MDHFSSEAENDHMSSRPRLSRAEGFSFPSIIGATCAFDAKFYKIVDAVFNVSALLILSKKFLTFFIFVRRYKRFWSEIRKK